MRVVGTRRWEKYRAQRKKRRAGAPTRTPPGEAVQALSRILLVVTKDWSARLFCGGGKFISICKNFQVLTRDTLQCRVSLQRGARDTSALCHSVLLRLIVHARFPFAKSWRFLRPIFQRLFSNFGCLETSNAPLWFRKRLTAVMSTFLLQDLSG